MEGERTSDNQVRSENGHTTDTHTGFGGSIGGTEAGEDDGRGAAEGAEEGLSMWMSVIVMRLWLLLTWVKRSVIGVEGTNRVNRTIWGRY